LPRPAALLFYKIKLLPQFILYTIIHHLATPNELALRKCPETFDFVSEPMRWQKRANFISRYSMIGAI